MTSVRTRFAPSPTGYLHIGGARTALFAWAFARHHHGQFLLRIEDTDLERSTPAAVQAILQGMQWLGLEYDEGPFYQTQHMDRYRAVLQQMLEAGSAYYCYASPSELDEMREAQRQRGEKPRYDGRWRPEIGKDLPPPPRDIQPVIRFRSPTDGVTAWHDLVKGEISFQNSELDDLILARADGTPTYNFCVVVDDSDMQITHVIRGDDHVNNTPRQINLFHALGIKPPVYAHLSMIQGDDGQKLSKRHGAVSVMQYRDMGYVPDAIINYLARLGWSHGDEEVFSRQQLVEWFDLNHITSAPAQFNTTKLRWLNQHYLKAMPAESLQELVLSYLSPAATELLAQQANLTAALQLYVNRCHDLCELADAIHALFAPPPAITAEQAATHLGEVSQALLTDVLARLSAIAAADWQVASLKQVITEVRQAHHVKMPQIAVPLRVALLGQSESPSVDAIMFVLGKEACISRLQHALATIGNI